jgi:transposase-like protein
MLPPHNGSVAQLSEQEGISQAILYLWRKTARAQGRLMPDSDHNSTEQWSSQNKFAVVLESASLNEVEVGEYCRKRGGTVRLPRVRRVKCELPR